MIAISTGAALLPVPALGCCAGLSTSSLYHEIEAKVD